GIRVRAEAFTMSSIRFICQGCRQPMRLSQSTGTLGLETTQRPAASTFTSAQQEPRETLVRGPTSKVEIDTEKGRICEEEMKTLQEELEGLELEEARLVQELKEVENKQERVAEDLEAAQAETEMLEQQDKQYWKDYSNLKWQQLELQDELKSMERQLRHAQIQWGRLKKTSVFSATFEIRYDGPVGIINSFRLGCLPTVPVSWKEINMAWGQTALLLLALSNKIGLEFRRYQLIPCGNRSYLKLTWWGCGQRTGNILADRLIRSSVGSHQVNF
uniref:Beclin 2 n=1 Tax=Canis lupus dingo TaxID=286419 RepID=A0A8C0QSU6_CANLU